MEKRGADGRIIPFADKFPSGMKALGDYIHSKGLKFGVYSDTGNHTCEGYPGSMGYEKLVSAITWRCRRWERAGAGARPARGQPCLL